MKSPEIYGSTVAVNDRTVTIKPDLVVYSAEAVSTLIDMAGKFTTIGKVSVISDVRTRNVAGARISAALSEAGFDVNEVELPDAPNGASPACDQNTHRYVLSRIEGSSLIVSAGSGVVNDLGKWASFTTDIPYLVFATALSMTGYTSANVASTVDGVKVLQRARPPEGVFSDPRIASDAPYELTAAGFGDVLAKTVSTVDWLLNHRLFGDEFIRKSVEITDDLVPVYLNDANLFAAKDPEALASLFDGLMLTGVAMTIAGTSSPASGGEHLISHTLDMIAPAKGVEHDLHGRQVGVGTVLCAELYRRIVDMENPEWSVSRASVEDFSFWDPLQEPVVEAYGPKTDRIERAAEVLSRGNAWDELREEISNMIPATRTIRDALINASAAYLAEHIGCSREYLLDAFLHAHEMRGRFTVLDLARLVGVMPNAGRDLIWELC